MVPKRWFQDKDGIFILDKSKKQYLKDIEKKHKQKPKVIIKEKIIFQKPRKGGFRHFRGRKIGRQGRSKGPQNLLEKKTKEGQKKKRDLVLNEILLQQSKQNLESLEQHIKRKKGEEKLEGDQFQNILSKAQLNDKIKDQKKIIDLMGSDFENKKDQEAKLFNMEQQIKQMQTTIQQQSQQSPQQQSGGSLDLTIEEDKSPSSQSMGDKSPTTKVLEQLQQTGLGNKNDNLDKEGLQVKQLLILISNDLYLNNLHKEWSIQVIHDQKQMIKTKVGTSNAKNYIVIFIKDNHFRVLLYDNYQQELVYFNSYGLTQENDSSQNSSRGTFAKDQQQIQDFSFLLSKEDKIKLKINDVVWQERGNSVFDQSYCGLYAYIFIHKYVINSESFKEATQYDDETKEHADNLDVENIQSFPFI